MKTGDKLVCSGTSKLSKAISLTNRINGVKGEAADLTHVAMVVERVDIHKEVLKVLDKEWEENRLKEATPALFPPLCYVLEATTLNKWAGKKGVQINPYADWIHNYQGRVTLKEREFEHGEIETIKSQMFIKDNINKPYESGIPGGLELLLCGNNKLTNLIVPEWIREGVRKRIRTQTELHCTELITMYDQQVYGRMSDINPSRNPPCNWWEVKGYKEAERIK